MRNRANYALLILTGYLCVTPSASAQIKDAVQKLMPATVAVELKVKPRPVQQLRARRDVVPTPDYAGVKDGYDLQQAPVDAVTYASGTVVSDQGLIVTMIGDVKDGEIAVTFRDGKQSPATLLVDDRRSGLQLIHVKDVVLPAVDIADGDAALGEQVVSVMCTDLHHLAAATGIVAATNRSIEGIAAPLLQTDLSIGPMSAGAPVADLDGKLVGIWLAREGRPQGASFAVPAKIVKQMLAALDGNKPQILKRGYLGVALGAGDDSNNFARITQVGVGTAAHEAGLMNGDVILEINDQPIRVPEDVVRTIGQHLANDEVEVKIDRDGEEKQLSITLKTFPERAERSLTDADQASQDAVLFLRTPSIYGLDDSGKLRRYGMEEGKVIRIEDTKPTLNLDEDQTKALIQYYQKAMEAQTEVGSVLGQATVRVQRSNVEQKLGELTDRVVSLQAEVEKLTKELKTLGESLDK